jgi:tetratricopeptide (TPR) repeat protein
MKFSAFGYSLALALVAILVVIAMYRRSDNKSDKDANTMIFRNAGGEQVTLDEIQAPNGLYSYAIVGSGKLPKEAVALHEQGREEGAQGHYNDAITSLTRAAAIASDWPYPIYDRAFTYLLLKDYDHARSDYAQTIKMSPRGFFTALTAVDTLEKEKRGELPVGTYLLYTSLEDEADRSRKLELVRILVNKVPRFAPAWKELAVLSTDNQERLAAIETGLANKPDGETRGILLINKAAILSKSGDKQAAVHILEELIQDKNSTLGTEEQAKAFLPMIAKEK